MAKRLCTSNTNYLWLNRSLITTPPIPTKIKGKNINKTSLFNFLQNLNPQIVSQLQIICDKTSILVWDHTKNDGYSSITTTKFLQLEGIHDSKKDHAKNDRKIQQHHTNIILQMGSGEGTMYPSREVVFDRPSTMKINNTTTTTYAVYSTSGVRTPYPYHGR